MDYRITQLRAYLFNILDGMLKNSKYEINVNMLDNNVENYSLDKIPTSSTIERWINGTEIHRDVFSFRSRCSYSQDALDNLNNIGFFETFEKIIKSNNTKGILPDIKGIEKIECLNTGTMVSAETKTAEFDIQIQITYKEEV